jgi:Domain of unknown function (DUF4232)
MVDASGSSIATTVVRGGSYPFTDFPPSTVTLAPDSTAFFNAGYTDVPSGSETTCPASAQLRVTPPNDFSQLVTDFKATVCNSGTLTFSPVFGPGSPHTATTAPPQG